MLEITKFFEKLAFRRNNSNNVVVKFSDDSKKPIKKSEKLFKSKKLFKSQNLAKLRKNC